MPLPSEYRRDAAWLAWQAGTLAAALGLAPVPVPAGLFAAALGAWLLLGWRRHYLARPVALFGAGVLAAGVFAWGLPWRLAWFFPFWSGLLVLPVAAPLVRRRLASRHSWVHRAGALWGAVLPPVPPGRRFEALRLGLAVLAGAAATLPFAHNGIMGGVDGKWYTAVVADHLEQWRHGFGPVFVGQTRFAANGEVMPLRVAPYLQHLTLALDFATGRGLAPWLLLNLAVIATGVGTALTAYLGLASLLPGRRTEALLLALLYLLAPATLGLAYNGQLYMSVMALPFPPLVFTGLAWIHERRGFSGWALVAAGCAAAWMAHSPIGLWLSLSAGATVGLRWIGDPGRVRVEWGRAAGALGLFLLLAGYVFVSVGVLAPPAAPPVARYFFYQSVREAFPASLAPVSAGAGLTSDWQLGWSLWAALAAGTYAAWRGPRGVGRPVSAVALVLVVLVLPVPFLNWALWQLVPQVLLDATNAVPTQRLYALLAAAAAVLAALALRGQPRRPGLLAGLAALVAWSALQFVPFWRRGHDVANSAAASAEALSPSDLVLTRFSQGLLGTADPFYCDGVRDFNLEQRILDPSQRTYLVTNVGAVAPGWDFGRRAGPPPALEGRLTGTAAPGEKVWLELDPHLELAPGGHYLLALDLPPGACQGVLQLTGPGFHREYQLPMSGEQFAFGATKLGSRVIPLDNPSPRPLELAVRFINQDPAADLGRLAVFGSYQLFPYHPRDLPLQLVSLVPYTARIRTPRAGWYESARQFTPGWTALVNGQRSEVGRSRHGLVAVPVGAGESTVELAFRPPWYLVTAYGVGWAAWAFVLFAGLRQLLLRR